MLMAMIFTALTMDISVLAKEVFAELSEDPEVECTYISGRFAHNRRGWRSQSGEHGMSLERGFSSMWTYQLFSEKAVEKAKGILDRYLKENKGIELVMETKTGSQSYRIYEKFAMLDGKEMITQMIIWSNDAPNVGEICVINWDNGLEPSKNPYSYSMGRSRGLSLLQKGLAGKYLPDTHKSDVL